MDRTTGGRWVIDPLDGTVNYANGIPFYCVSIGLVVDDRPSVGVIFDPARDDLYTATADGPAALDGEPVEASTKETLSDYVVSLAVIGRGGLARERRIAPQIRIHRRMGSAALALAYVANGRFDAFVQNGGLSPWDVAAAGLIAERAGAVVTDLDGGPWWNPRIAGPRTSVVAAPPAQHGALLELLPRGQDDGPDPPLGVRRDPSRTWASMPSVSAVAPQTTDAAVPIRAGAHGRSRARRTPRRRGRRGPTGRRAAARRSRSTSASCGTRVGRAATVPTNGTQLEVADRDPDVVERADDPHDVRLEADLLPRLAQRGGLAATASVASTAPPGSETSPAWARRSACRTVSGIDEAAVGVGVDRQQGRGRARRRERGAVESAPAWPLRRRLRGSSRSSSGIGRGARAQRIGRAHPPSRAPRVVFGP